MCNAVVNYMNLRRGKYVIVALEEHCLNGDAYTTEEALYRLCKRKTPELAYETYRADLDELLRLGILHLEDGCLYLMDTWRYEETAAKEIASILNRAPLAPACLPKTPLQVNGVPLCDEQYAAIRLALSSRLSLILGGAGTGKSSLIQALCRCSGNMMQTVICAPTGKAARNLEAKLHHPVRTVHGALGITPNDDWLSPVRWNMVRLVVVDEASMMSVGMLAGILDRASSDCRIVLVGDPNQLMSVGSGNVLQDLLELKIPCIVLEENHRLSINDSALTYNVKDFDNTPGAPSLVWDESFRLDEMSAYEARYCLIRDAVACYRRRENILVLSPYNNKGTFSAVELNKAIRNELNPVRPGVRKLRTPNGVLVDGDRVLITRNDRTQNVSNGDVGILHIIRTQKGRMKYAIEISDGRMPVWEDENAQENLPFVELAYVLTVHKSQGSEYDTVLMAMTPDMYVYRNLFYTAISRARNNVHLYGSMQAVDNALQRLPRPRKSMLVQKTLKFLN